MIDEYERYVRTCVNRSFSRKRDAEDKPIIFNRSVAHASTLIKILASSAKATIDVVSGNLNLEVYGASPVIEAFRHFLEEPQARLRVVLDNFQVGSVPPFIHEVMSDGGYNERANAEKIEVRIATPEVADQIKFHFLVVDGRSYRFEEDKTKFDAIAQFNNEELGRRLTTRFNEIWEASQAV